MKVRHIILRYFSIMGRLSNGKRATYLQLKSHIENQIFNVDSSEEIRFSLRTFQREILEIESLFNVEIVCNSEGQYYIAENHMSQEVERFAQNFLFINYQKYFENFEDHIAFDHSCVKGIEYLSDIQHAIKNKNCLLLKYAKFNQKDPSTQNRNIAPYGLKEYKGRWYLLGKDIDKNEFRTFGLDRIHELAVTNQRFVMPTGFNIYSHFNESIGVTIDKDKPTEIVELKTNKFLGNYIKNLPLHTTQKIVEENEESIVFRFKLQINNELINELMQYSDDLTIIRPLSLRNKLIKRAQQIIENHQTLPS